MATRSSVAREGEVRKPGGKAKHVRRMGGPLGWYPPRLFCIKARDSPATANIAGPGQSITVSGNPNGLPALVPASIGDNLGLLMSSIVISIPNSRWN